MRTCSNCGFEVKPGDLFCASCGTAQAESQVNGDSDVQPVAVSGFGGMPTVSARPSLQVGAGRAGVRSDPMALGGAGSAGPAAEPLSPVAAQEGYFASTRGAGAGAHASSARAETIEQKYLRQTRTATVFIAIIVGIFTTLMLIGGIWTAIKVSEFNSEVNGFTSGINSSNCQSQGGTNPTC